jgi:tetratricopeptide (TPR) repeat protein
MDQTTFPTDLSSYAHRSLPRLSARERSRFLKAWRLLGAGGILAVTREGDMALLGPGVCEALLARSWAARHHDPEEMLHLATVARDVAARLKVRDLGQVGVTLLQARAWAELANAFRVAGRLPAAEAAFEEAFGISNGLVDLHLSTHLLELRATLHGERGDLDSATQLLSIVTGVYDQAHERRPAGRARITHSIYVALRGRNEDALRLNAEGLARIEPAQDSVLIMTALHNRLILALRLGAQDEARRTLALCPAFDSECAVALALRLRGMEGRVLQDLGELDKAETALRQSHEGLAALGLKPLPADAHRR